MSCFKAFSNTKYGLTRTLLHKYHSKERVKMFALQVLTRTLININEHQLRTT